MSSKLYQNSLKYKREKQSIVDWLTFRRFAAFAVVIHCMSFYWLYQFLENLGGYGYRALAFTLISVGIWAMADGMITLIRGLRVKGVEAALENHSTEVREKTSTWVNTFDAESFFRHHEDTLRSIVDSLGAEALDNDGLVDIIKARALTEKQFIDVVQPLMKQIGAFQGAGVVTKSSKIVEKVEGEKTA